MADRPDTEAPKVEPWGRWFERSAVSAESRSTDALAANAIAAALTARFGYVPLSVRYRVAHAAIEEARGWIRDHAGAGFIDPSEPLVCTCTSSMRADGGRCLGCIADDVSAPVSPGEAIPTRRERVRYAIREIEGEAGGTCDLLQPGAAFALGALAEAVEAGPGCTADMLADALSGSPVAETPAEPVVPKGDETSRAQRPTPPRGEYMAIYDDFWRELVEVDGQPDRDKVARELSDYSHIMNELPILLDQITGGRMSKCMYFARDMIAETEDHYGQIADEAVKEARDEWEAEHGGPVPAHPGVARPDDKIRALYETARLSVLHGVTWNGTIESAGGVSKDEALNDAADLIQAIEDAGGVRALLAGGDPNA